MHFGKPDSVLTEVSEVIILILGGTESIGTPRAYKHNIYNYQTINVFGLTNG